MLSNFSAVMATLLGVLIVKVILPQPTEAWVPTTPTCQAFRLKPLNANPFDWLLNPKKSEKEKKSGDPVDFFANWFQTTSGPPSQLPSPSQLTKDEVQPILSKDKVDDHEDIHDPLLIVSNESSPSSSSVSTMDDNQKMESLLVKDDCRIVQNDLPLDPPSPVNHSSTPPSKTIHQGKVLWFDARKGYGFVMPDNSGHDSIFVHHSNIANSQGQYRRLIRGESVEFQLDQDAKGRTIAVHVTGPHGTAVKSILEQKSNDPRQQLQQEAQKSR